MKKASSLFICLISAISFFGQDYYPIVQQNREWNVLQVTEGLGWWDTTYYTFNYKLDGDTFINDLSYLKVYVSYEGIPLNWTFDGCIREDSSGKVYFRFWGTDYLKYDFGAQTGDTIEIYTHDGYPVQARVGSIDSVAINGTYRKVFDLDYLSYGDTHEKWIEGIGSNRGILQSGQAGYVGGWTWFLCESDNGELIYVNSDFGTCSLFNVGIKETNSFGILLSPNPARGKIKVEYPETIKPEAISMFDFTGKKIKEFEPSLNYLDISGIPSGIYFLNLIYEKAEIIKKILVE